MGWFGVGWLKRTPANPDQSDAAPSALPRDQVQTESKIKFALGANPISQSPAERKADLWMSPTGRSHGGTGTPMPGSYLPANPQPRRRGAPAEQPEQRARNAPVAPGQVPERNRQAHSSEGITHPTEETIIHETSPASMKSSKRTAHDDAVAAQNDGGNGVATHAVSSMLKQPTSQLQNTAAQSQVVRHAPQQRESLTSAQNTALQVAIDAIGIALVNQPNEETIARSMHELQQLLDESRPIGKCEVQHPGPMSETQEDAICAFGRIVYAAESCRLMRVQYLICRDHAFSDFL
jgi:hypothetical protein